MLEMRFSRSISDNSKHKRKSIFSLKSCRKCAFLCQFSKQKNLDLIYWYMKRSENSQQFWLKIYLDYLSNWTHLILLLVFLLCRSNFHLKIIAIFLFQQCTMLSKICNKSAISGSYPLISFLQIPSTKLFPKKDVKF